MKIYQQLEQLFKFRIMSNEEIRPYLTKLSRMGKLDGPKEHALFILILERLGQMEDAELTRENIAPPPGIIYPFIPVRRSGTLTNIKDVSGADDKSNKVIEKEINTSKAEREESFLKETYADMKGIAENVKDITCPECGKLCASDFGLKSHVRSHKK